VNEIVSRHEELCMKPRFQKSSCSILFLGGFLIAGAVLLGVPLPCEGPPNSACAAEGIDFRGQGKPTADELKAASAIGVGLAWLSRHQAQDGHWSLDTFDKAAKCDCAGKGSAMTCLQQH
jgi:hypothetical protein